MAKKITTKDFIERARKIHGNRYDYSQSEYTKSGDPILIGCGTHGFFKQVEETSLGDGFRCFYSYKKTA
jgi:hypothetical protein